MKKKYTCIGLLMSLMACNLMAQTESIKPVYAGMPLGVVSSNGEWLGGTYRGATFIYNTITDDLTFLTEMNDLGSGIGAISPGGLAVGGYGNETSAAAAICKDGEWKVLPYPANSKVLDGGVYGVTDDETLLAGYVMGTPYKGMMYLPCIWRLEEDEYKFEMLPAPERDVQGQVPQGSIVKDISRDGTVLLGEFTDWSGMHKQPVVWIKEGGSYTYKLLGTEIIFNLNEENPGICPEYDNYVTVKRGDPGYDEQFKYWTSLRSKYSQKMAKFETGKKFNTNYLRLSGNGRWLVTTILEPLEGHQTQYSSYAYRLDLSDGSGAAYRSIPQVRSAAIMDDGTLWATVPLTNFTQAALVFSGTTYVTADEWIKEKIGIDVSDDLTFTLDLTDPQTQEPIQVDSIITGYPLLSKDGSVLAGTLWDPAGERGYINYYLYTGIPDAMRPASLPTNNGITVTNKCIYFPGQAERITLTELTGKTVCNIQTAACQVDVSHLPEGIYIVRWVTGGQIKAKKVIIK